MELWLLGAGAVVLIGITLWIVWPARTSDTVETPIRGEEVSRTPMTENSRPAMAPQGDRFEDQYTSATADLSAGGVATAFASEPATPSTEAHSVPTQEPVPQTRGQRWPEASTAGEPIGQPSRADNFPYEMPAGQSRGLVQPKSIGIGAGTLLALGSAAGGAWLYARWQRERNKPINRLRRGARDVASRLTDRLPDVVDDLPMGPAPIGGAASALLLAALLGSRAMRHNSSDDRADELRSRARDMGGDALKEVLGRGRDALSSDSVKDAVTRGRHVAERGRNESRRFAARLPYDRFSEIEPRQRGIFGLGFGGLAIVAGGTYMVWRLLRGGNNPSQQTWYAGE
ncbi:MAG TPA: hypothetical protein VGQ62_10520 [Chloroflexota bacterium]|jgi:hypothetical protein|nr:hypothetical protein [Chloroflexota bacterium]